MECLVCGIDKSASKKGGLCIACRSWWSRINLFSANELGDYIERRRFYSARLNARLEHLGRRQGRPLLRRVK